MQQFERELAALKLGVRASVVLYEDQGVTTALTFGKHGQEWRLLLEDAIDGEEQGNDLPLRGASREVRPQAVDRFVDLVEQMIKVADEEIERVEGSTAVTRELIKSLAGAKP